MKKIRRGSVRLPGVLVAAAMALALVAGSAGAAAAAIRPAHFHGGSGGRPAVAGTVAVAPVGDTFSITTRSGTTETVNVGLTTTYVERGVSSPTLTNVTAGALVAVFGTTSGTTVTATEVSIWVPKTPAERPVVAGTVAVAPVGDTFSITTHSGTTDTITVGATTTYVQHGVSSPSLSNVTVGELVAVFGTTSGTSVTATEVAIANPRHSKRNFATTGTVASAPSGDAFTVTTWNGTTDTITVGATTTYIERGVSSPSLANVTVGEFVAVFGTTSGTAVTATEVAIAKPKLDKGNFATAGTVASAPVGDAFTVTTWNGSTQTVNVSLTTTYAEYGVASPSLTNVTVGEFVGVFGTTSGSMTTATEVVIAGSQSRGLFGFGHPFHFKHGRFGGWGGFGFGRGR